MNPKLSDYFAQKRLEEKQARDALLISQGLYEKVYAPNDEWSEEYPENEYDQERQVYRYFKKVVIEVTDEEYEQIKKYAFASNSLPETNDVAKALTFIAYAVYIVGLIAGIIIVEPMGIAVSVVCWIITAISGTMFLGFSEIIKLLQSIKNKN